MAAEMHRAAVAPFSNDSPVKVLLDPNGDVVVAITGYASPNRGAQSRKTASTPLSARKVTFSKGTKL